MISRPRSLPPATSTSRVTRSQTASSPSNNLIAVHRSKTIVPNPNPNSSCTDNASSSLAAPSRHGRSPTLSAQAEALARMTFEMNLRTVGRQSERLERELRSLVQKTSNNEAFRAQHEARLQDLWKEILAVKAHLTQDRPHTRDLSDVECRDEMRRLVDGMRGELDSVRRMVGDISKTVSAMPTSEQLQAALSQSSDGMSSTIPSDLLEVI